MFFTVFKLVLKKYKLAIYVVAEIIFCYYVFALKILIY